jgi:activator of 2-hydroxyglutaryl-CoA dehydratase
MREKSNLFQLTAKERARKEARQQYYNIKIGLIVTGTGLFVVGAIAFTIERAGLETTDQNTLSWLSFIYNSLPMLGAAILSAVGFHHRAKRNAEVDRIEEIDEELEQIRIQRLDLLREIQEEKDEAKSYATKPTHSRQTVAGIDFGSLAHDTVVRTASAEGDGHRNRLDGHAD